MDRKEEKERTMTGRNKNMVCGALLCAMMLSMTACGNEIPDLTEEESQPEGVSITYEDYMVADSYPEDGVEDDYFALDASMGKKLLVLRFHLTNGSEQEETIDLLNTNSRYIITVNDSIRANALTTMLPNDMSTYAETLEPGQTQELVLLLEVNEDVAGAVQTIALRLKNASNEYTIQLL